LLSLKRSLTHTRTCHYISKIPSTTKRKSKFQNNVKQFQTLAITSETLTKFTHTGCHISVINFKRGTKVSDLKREKNADLKHQHKNPCTLTETSTANKTVASKTLAWSK